MKQSLILVFLFFLPFLYVEAGEPKPYEMPRTQVVPIKDSKADRQYELYIRLPEGYAENTNTQHPVIYTTDAVWHMEMLSGATEYLMPNIIVVGISWQKDFGSERAHASRARDYTIVESETAEVPTGEASNHLSFIRGDVIPYVEKNYRTDPGKRAYFGYSAGGEFGAYILIAQPDTFTHYILGSPSLDQRSADYIDELEVETASRQQGVNTHVFLSIGEQETSQMDLTRGYVLVLQRRFEAGLSLTGLEIIENSDHGTAFPETVIRSIKWLSQLTAE